MKKCTAAIFLSLALLCGSSTLAAAEEAASPPQSEQADQAQDLPWIKAKVKKVNADAAKVTLSHEEITNLDMPGMTMVFSLANKEMLNGLSEGAAIDAQFAEVDGRYVVQAWRISE